MQRAWSKSAGSIASLKTGAKVIPSWKSSEHTEPDMLTELK